LCSPIGLEFFIALLGSGLGNPVFPNEAAKVWQLATAAIGRDVIEVDLVELEEQ
jgi:hypothetical protein